MCDVSFVVLIINVGVFLVFWKRIFYMIKISRVNIDKVVFDIYFCLCFKFYLSLGDK